MSGFTYIPPAADLPAPPTPASVIQGDAFFPAIDPAVLRAVVRIDTTVTDARLRDAAIAAIIGLELELDLWRAVHVLAGWATLAAVPGPMIDGASRWVALYRRAVYATVAADLADALPTIGVTASGQDRAGELSTVADDHRRNARWAVRDLTGRRRTTVELI